MAYRRERQKRPSLADCFQAVRRYFQVWADSTRELYSWNVELKETKLSRQYFCSLRPQTKIRDPEGQIRPLLDLLQSRACPDPDAVFKIIRLIAIMKYGGGALEYTIESMRVREAQYQENVWFSDSHNERKYLMSTALGRCDKQFLQVLVSYGLALRLPMSEWEFEILCDFFSLGEGANGIPGRTIYRQLKRKNGRMTSRNRRGFERIHHIVRLMRVVTTLKRNSKETHAAVVQTYLDTLPDPLVTSEEIREFQLLRYPDRPEIVDRTVQAFVDLFGDQQAYEPRRLTHLCRCTVRNTIVRKSSVTLPAAIGRLDLPSAIKDFILLDPGWSSRQK